MKEIFLIKDTPGNKISYYLLLCFVVALPYDRFYSELFLVFFALHTLLHRKPRPVFRWNDSPWILAALYLAMVCCSFYSSWFSLALHQWEIQLSLLLLPLLFWINPIDTSAYRNHWFLGFALSCLCLVIYLYAYAGAVMFQNHFPFSRLFDGSFLNQYFSYPVGTHPTYLAMYCGFSMLVFIQEFRSAHGLLNKSLWLICSFVCFAGLLQLASKAVWIALIFILNIVIPAFEKNKRSRRRLIMVFATITMVTVTFAWLNHGMHARLISQFSGDLDRQALNKTIPEPRILRWQAAWELVEKSPVFGYGTGSEIPLLKNKYADHHLLRSLYFELNTHNQFLALWINTGLLGLFIYFLLFVRGGWRASKAKDGLGISFLLILFLVSLSENILGLNKGIFFLSFFYPLLFSFLPRQVNSKDASFIQQAASNTAHSHPLQGA